MTENIASTLEDTTAGLSEFYTVVKKNNVNIPKNIDGEKNIDCTRSI